MKCEAILLPIYPWYFKISLNISQLKACGVLGFIINKNVVHALT